MIDIRIDPRDWNAMTDEEQRRICMAVVNEYERLEKPVHDRLPDLYFQKSSVGGTALIVIHGWCNTRANLRNCSERPPRLDENLSVARWKHLWPLYNACGLLEYIGSLYQEIL